MPRRAPGTRPPRCAPARRVPRPAAPALAERLLRRRGLQARAGLVEAAQAGQDLVGQRQVVAAEGGGEVEDRDAAFGRLGVADAAPDHRVEDLRPEALLERLPRL